MTQKCFWELELMTNVVQRRFLISEFRLQRQKIKRVLHVSITENEKRKKNFFGRSFYKEESSHTFWKRNEKTIDIIYKISLSEILIVFDRNFNVFTICGTKIGSFCQVTHFDNTACFG